MLTYDLWHGKYEVDVFRSRSPCEYENHLKYQMRKIHIRLSGLFYLAKNYIF